MTWAFCDMIRNTLIMHGKELKIKLLWTHRRCACDFLGLTDFKGEIFINVQK
jgi:hypothetical protein